MFFQYKVKICLLSVLVSMLLLSCDSVYTIYLVNRLEYDIELTYMTTDGFTIFGYYTEDGDYVGTPDDGQYRMRLVESGETTKLFSRLGFYEFPEDLDFFVTDSLLSGESDFDFYMKNTMTGEVFLTKNETMRNPLVSFEKIMIMIPYSSGDEIRKREVWAMILEEK